MRVRLTGTPGDLARACLVLRDQAVIWNEGAPRMLDSGEFAMEVIVSFR
ncbi:hypothetical protein [Streptosporangium sp. NPDC051022]